jgi:hypothetical protein
MKRVQRKGWERIQCLTARGGDNIAQPVGTEHTIDKTVGLAIGKTDLNAIHKTIGTKTAFLLVF